MLNNSEDFMPTIKTLILFSIFSAAALALFLGSGELRAQGQAQNFTVGVVDVRKAIGDSKEGKAASTKLESKYNTLKKTLDAKQAELTKKDEDLRKQSSTLSQDALEKRSQSLMAEVASFRDQAQKSTEEMQKAFDDAMAPISKKAEKITAEIAKSRGFSMVIDAAAGGVLFVDPSFNITDEVIKRMDSSK
jgi:outer membrane protein